MPSSVLPERRAHAGWGAQWLWRRSGVRVQELWRYPVKSLQGEQLSEALVTADGIAGDRRYAIIDLATGLGLTARRVPQLLFASASLTADGRARITLPDGSVA